MPSAHHLVRQNYQREIEQARYKYEGKKKNLPAQPHNLPQKLTALLAVLGE